MTGCFQHISVAVSDMVDQVFETAIRRAVDEGDTAKAERLRHHWRGSKEGQT